MEAALTAAGEAGRRDEVPIGAVVVDWDVALGVAQVPQRWNEALLAISGNGVVGSRNVTHHAELLALAGATQRSGTMYLPACRLYVTVEPCVMCFGAALAHRLAALVYAAPSPKFGALSVCNLHASGAALNHRMDLCVAPPHQVAAAATLMRTYFQGKRLAGGTRPTPHHHMSPPFK